MYIGCNRTPKYFYTIFFFNITLVLSFRYYNSACWICMYMDKIAYINIYINQGPHKK